MFKIAILGCENSHADTFLKFIYEDKLYDNVEVKGVFSRDRAAAERLSEKFAVPVMDSFDELVGKLDGVIITARHGDDHHTFAKPYIESGIPMFIDKPITINEEDAKSLSDELAAHGVRVCGGSCCKHAPYIQELKKKVQEAEKVFGGAFRAPVDLKNDYGDFYFYAEHLTDVVCEIFGKFPISVRAQKTVDSITVTFHYEKYDVTGLYVNHSYRYFASVFTDSESAGEEYPVGRECFLEEFEEFYRLLCGGEQEITYEEFIFPVYILNAIDRALKSGQEEKIG